MSGPYWYFYQVAMILSLVASFLIVALIWRRRQAPGASSVIALAFCTFVWTLGYLLESRSTTLDRQLLFSNIGYLGSTGAPVAWFIFAMHYTSGNRLVTGWKIVPFCLLPLFIVVLVWTNDWHHLMWSNAHLGTSGEFTVTIKTYGTFFWVMIAYDYILVVTGSIVLIRRLFVGTPLYAMQAVSLIVTVSLPFIWNILYFFNLKTMPHKDLTPVMFTISGIAMVLGLMRYRLFLAVPFARQFLIRQMSDGLLVFDMHHRVLEANPAALRVLGVSRDFIGKKVDTPVSSSLPEYLPPNQSGCFEITLKVSGEERFYELENVSMHDNQGQQVGWLVVLRDISGRKKIQEQLIAQDRLASIGKLASGIAHELNNPLATVIGFSELLLKKNLPDDIHSDLNIIYNEAERAAAIVDNLLTFARQKSEAKVPCDINGIIKKTLQLRTYEQEKNYIHTILHLAPELPEIKGHELQIQQLFLNIIINAEFFMIETHKKGTLIIETRWENDFVRISFKDDGPGIPKENMQYIFNPFFTTKEVGKGTGLGLSICHGIVTEHGGKIWAESTPDEGATFIIELPVYGNRVTVNGNH
jgi:PAS domain S-box-containing protein